MTNVAKKERKRNDIRSYEVTVYENCLMSTTNAQTVRIDLVLSEWHRELWFPLSGFCLVWLRLSRGDDDG